MLADAYSSDVVRGQAEGFIFIFKLYTFSFFYKNPKARATIAEILLQL
jgi:hypothetical protein